MPEILSLNNFHLAKNGVRLVYGDTTVYNLHLDQAIGGTITANRMSGNRGDVVTLYNNPSAGYSFDNYSVTGSTLTGVQVRFNREDIYVAPSFTHNVYNINLQQTTGGTITSDKSTGYYGDTVTLSNTPAEHYGFRDYSITGATLTGNQFKINESNVTAKANFSAWPVRNVSVQQRTGGTIASNKSTGYDGDVVTLSNTANAGYTFTNYNVTGATLTGNQFAFNGGNVTAQGAFNHDVYNLTLQQTSGGTITANKTTGYYGDTVTLSSNIEPGYLFEGYSITGSTLTGNQFKFNTNDVTAKANIIEQEPLAPLTIRLKYKQGTKPKFSKGVGVLYNAEQNIWDLTYNDTNWKDLLDEQTNLIEVLSANTEGVWNMANMFLHCTALNTVQLFDTKDCVNMASMFYGCSSLSSVPLFNTSKVSTMARMFYNCFALSSVPLFDTSNVEPIGLMFMNCTALTSIPLYNTNKVTTMDRMCCNCYNVQSGALALYQQASTQANPPSDHTLTFYNCGVSSRTGSAELAQIPSDWK